MKTKLIPNYTVQISNNPTLFDVVSAWKDKLKNRSDKIELLDAFLTMLEKDGYVDSDAREDNVIDKFLDRV